MKSLVTKHKNITLLVGIVLAIMVGFSNGVYAEDTEKAKSTLSAEDREFFAEYFNRGYTPKHPVMTYHFFDQDGKKVYSYTIIEGAESTNSKLQSLLIESEVLMTFDNISYLVVE